MNFSVVLGEKQPQNIIESITGGTIFFDWNDSPLVEFNLECLTVFEKFYLCFVPPLFSFQKKKKKSKCTLANFNLAVTWQRFVKWRSSRSITMLTILVQTALGCVVTRTIPSASNSSAMSGRPLRNWYWPRGTVSISSFH